MRRVKLIKRMSLLLLGLTVALFAVATWARPNTVEVQPRVEIPTYASDIDRVMAAYESMVNRMLDQQQIQLINVAQENRALTEQVMVLDHKLDQVLQKLSRMEKAMGLAPDQPDVPVAPIEDAAPVIAP